MSNTAKTISVINLNTEQFPCEERPQDLVGFAVVDSNWLFAVNDKITVNFLECERLQGKHVRILAEIQARRLHPQPRFFSGLVYLYYFNAGKHGCYLERIQNVTGRVSGPVPYCPA